MCLLASCSKKTYVQHLGCDNYKYHMDAPEEIALADTNDLFVITGYDTNYHNCVITVHIGFDNPNTTVFPNYKEADKLTGIKLRYSDWWCALATFK